jgi:hypothetical protein
MNPLAIAIISGISLLLLSLLIDRFLNPLLLRRRAKKFLKNKSKIDIRALENPKNGILLADADHLTVKDREGNSWSLEWDEIKEVHRSPTGLRVVG